MEWAAAILSLVVKEAALAGRPDLDLDDVCEVLILAVQVSRQFERQTLQTATAQQLAAAATEFLRTGQTSIGQCQHVRDAVVRFRQLASATCRRAPLTTLTDSAEPSAVAVREAQHAEAGMGPSSDVQQDLQVVDADMAAKPQQSVQEVTAEHSFPPAGGTSNAFGALPTDHTA